MTLVPKNADNILEMLRDGRHFSEKVGNQIHVVDSVTGEPRYIFLASTNHTPTMWVERTLPSGNTCLVQENVDPVIASTREFAFSPIIIDLLCSRLIQSGKGLTKICDTDEDMPSYTTLCAWRRTYPWIDERINQARRDRAERLRDEAIERVDAVTTKDEVSIASLQSEVRKWAAGVDDGKYSPKAKVEATINVPTQIVVHTGVSKEPLTINKEPDEAP